MSEQRYNYLADTLEERNAGFLKALCEDIEKLQSCSFSDNQIKRMLGTMNYIRIYCNQPQWILPAKKLPKGYKWTDGKKIKEQFGHGTHYKTVKSYTVLEAGEDLYIKGETFPGQNIHEQIFLRIPNWKMLSFRTIDSYMGVSGNVLRDYLPVKLISEQYIDDLHEFLGECQTQLEREKAREAQEEDEEQEKPRA